MSGSRMSAMIDEHAGSTSVIEGDDTRVQEQTTPDPNATPGQTTETTDPTRAQSVPNAGTVPGTDPNAQPGQQQRGDKKPDAQKQQTPGAKEGEQPETVDIQAFNRLQNRAAAQGRQVVKMQEDLRTTQTELRAYKEAAVLPTQLGLQPAEVAAGMQWMAHFKRDPAGAIRYALTEAQAMGHNIDLGNGIPSVDPAAIGRMMDERLQPFKSNLEADRKRAEAEAAVNREIEEVTTEFPWLNNQGAEVEQLLRTRPEMDLRTAALTIENYALRNRFDVNRSIGEQINERRTGPKQPQQPPQRPTIPSNARVPANGAVSGISQVPVQNGVLAETATNRDIVRSALMAAGLPTE